jgi:protein TonB
MSRVLMQLPVTPSTAIGSRAVADYFSSDQFVAVSLAVLLHLIVIALLLAGWQQNKPVAVVVNTIKVSMLMQAPTPVIDAPSSPPQMEARLPEAPAPIQKETPKPVIKEAQFSKKRVDEISTEKLLTEPLPRDDITPNVEVKMSDKQATEQTNSKVESQVSPQSQASTQAQANTQSAANFDTSQYFPVDKKAPAYPSRALDKGIQGACTVRYTVTTDGRVENPEAMDDCHAFFIKPSLEATKSFRYTPRMVDGKAVKVPNVKNTFQYRIE